MEEYFIGNEKFYLPDKEFDERERELFGWVQNVRVSSFLVF